MPDPTEPDDDFNFDEFLFGPPAAPTPPFTGLDHVLQTLGGILGSLFSLFLKGVSTLLSLWSSSAYWWVSLGMVLGATAWIASLFFPGKASVPVTLTPAQASAQQQQLAQSVAKASQALKTLGVPAGSIQTAAQTVQLVRGSEIASAARAGAAPIVNPGDLQSPFLVVSPQGPSHYQTLASLNVARYLHESSERQTPQTLLAVSAAVHGADDHQR